MAEFYKVPDFHALPIKPNDREEVNCYFQSLWTANFIYDAPNGAY